MHLKPTLRKATELGIGLSAIATLILTGCGGSGGGSSASPSASTTTLSISPSLGKFAEGATVWIKDQSGAQVGTGKVNASGVAAVDIPANTQGPLLIGAGLNGDQYYDEKQGQYVAVSGVSGAAVRALVPDLTATSQIGVTALTEIAVGSLADATGALPANIPAASAVGANNAVANSFGVANPLKPPKLVGSTADMAALGSTADEDKYAGKLAGLAHMAKPNENALKVAHRLRESMKGAAPASSVNAVVAAFNSAMSSASGVPSTLKNNARITPPATGASINLNELVTTAGNNAQLAQQVLAQQLGSTKPTQAQIVQAYTTAMQHYASAVQAAFANGSSIAAAANTANANANAALVAFFPSVITPGAGTSNGKVCVADAAFNGVPVAKFCYTNLTANFNCSQTGIQGAGGSMPTSVGAASFSFSLAAACPANAMMSFDVSKFVGGVGGGTGGGATGGTAGITSKSVCSSKGVSVALPASGVVGANWSDCSDQAPSNTRVVWGANQFVAVGNLNSVPIRTSTDGYTWVNRAGNSSSAGFNYNSVAFNGTRWIGIVRTTGFGINSMTADIGYTAGSAIDTWTTTKITLKNAGQLQNAFAANGRFFVSTGTSFLTSTDGINWIETQDTQCIGLAANVNKILWNNSKYLMYVEQRGFDWKKQFACTSSDGVAWTATPLTFSPASLTIPNTSNSRGGTYSLSFMPTAYDWNGSKFVAIQWQNIVSGSMDVWTSTDGIAWTKSTGQVPLYVNVSDMVWTGSQFIALGAGIGSTNSNTADTIATSNDGVTWQAQTSAPAGTSLVNLAYSPTLNRVLMTGEFLNNGWVTGRNALFVSP